MGPHRGMGGAFPLVGGPQTPPPASEPPHPTAAGSLSLTTV